MVAHPASLERGVSSRGGQQAGDARAGPEGGDVVGSPVNVRTLGAVAGDQAVDETRESFGDGRVMGQREYVTLLYELRKIVMNNYFRRKLDELEN